AISRAPRSTTSWAWPGPGSSSSTRRPAAPAAAARRSRSERQLTDLGGPTSFDLHPGAGLDSAVEDAEAHDPPQGGRADHRRGPARFTSIVEHRRALGGSLASLEHQPSQDILYAPAVVDPRHHLLPQVAPLGVADRLLDPRLLREALRAEVLAETGDPRLDAQRLQRLDPHGPGTLRHQPLRHQGSHRGRGPEGPGRGAQEPATLEGHLVAVDHDPGVA